MEAIKARPKIWNQLIRFETQFHLFSNELAMKTEITRKELYDLIWSQPMIHLAKEFNLSDNGLRKICKKNDIPFPNAGYWAKVKYGYKPPRTSLPKKKSVSDIIVIMINEHKPDEPQKRIDCLQEILSHKKLNFEVAKSLHGAELIVSQTKAYYENIRKRWDDPTFDQIVNRGGHLDVQVPSDSLPRALRIFNCLIKNLKILDYQVECGSKGTFIKSEDGLSQKISIRSKYDVSYTTDKSRWRTRELTANGLLCFKIGDYTPKEVKETESVKLEELIPKILSKIEGIFRKERMIKEQREIEWKERQRLEDIARIERERLAEIARKIQQAKDDELDKFKDFYKSAHRCVNSNYQCSVFSN